jgi:hypothetical protein
MESKNATLLKKMQGKLQKDIIANIKCQTLREYSVYQDFEVYLKTLFNFKTKLSTDIRENVKELKGTYLGSGLEVKEQEIQMPLADS